MDQSFYSTNSIDDDGPLTRTTAAAATNFEYPNHEPLEHAGGGDGDSNNNDNNNNMTGGVIDHHNDLTIEPSTSTVDNDDEEESFDPPPSSWYQDDRISDHDGNEHNDDGDHDDNHRHPSIGEGRIGIGQGGLNTSAPPNDIPATIPTTSATTTSTTSTTPQHILLPAYTGIATDLGIGRGGAGVGGHDHNHQYLHHQIGIPPSVGSTTTSPPFPSSLSQSHQPSTYVSANSTTTSSTSAAAAAAKAAVVVTYPSPSWKELSSQVLPAAARELLSSSLRRIYHTARLSYSRDVRWYRKYSDMGHNAGGYALSPTTMSNLDLPPNYHDRLFTTTTTNNNDSSTRNTTQSHRQSLNQGGATHNHHQYIPPFSSLSWVDRQLVKEWRTYLPEEERTQSNDAKTTERIENVASETISIIKDDRQPITADYRGNEQIPHCMKKSPPTDQHGQSNKEEETPAASIYLDCTEPATVPTGKDNQNEYSDIGAVADRRHGGNTIDDDEESELDDQDPPSTFISSVVVDDEYELFDFQRARTLVPNPLPRPTWQKADMCYECRKPFGPTRLRHHCRFCGKSFCQPHSSHNQRLPHLGYDPNVPERVCDGCHLMLEDQNMAERVAWRLARCRDYSANQLTPYFETGIDTAEDVARRVTRAAIAMAKSLPLGAQATVAVETVDVLRKYGLHGIYGIMLRQEFLAAADLLRKALGINKTSWPLSVHELSAAIFYALAQHRAMRGLYPDREHTIHSLRPSDTEEGTKRKARPSHVAAWTRTVSIPGTTITTRKSTINEDKFVPASEPSGSGAFVDSFEQSALSFHDNNPVIDQTDTYNPDFASLDSFQHVFADGRCKDPRRPLPDMCEESAKHSSNITPTSFEPVCDPVSDDELSSLLFYAPIALNFIYEEKEVEMQLLAAQQGWRIVYASLHQDMESLKPNDMPACAVFIHEEYKVACLSIRGTATINDVITDIRQTPVPFPNDLDSEQHPGDGDWTNVFHGQGLALSGMASAAVNLFREHIDSITYFAKRGYRIRLVGHSLGGGVATLIGVLILKHLEEMSDTIKSLGPTPKLQGESSQLLKVYAYGTPSCLDSKLAESVNSFVTTVVLHDDVFPRLTPTSCRGLLKHLLHIRETWVKAHIEEDLRAVGERAASVWAPRLRHNFTLGSSSSIKKFCKKKILAGRKKLASSSKTNKDKNTEVESSRKGTNDKEMVDGGISKDSDWEEAEEESETASSVADETASTASAENSKQERTGRDYNRETQLLLEFLGAGQSDEAGLVIDGEEFFETEQSLLEEEQSASFHSTHATTFAEPTGSPTNASIQTSGSWSTDIHVGSDRSPGKSSTPKAELSESDEGLTHSGNGAVVLDENPLPRMFIPGKIVHVYSHRGVYKATFVPRRFRELRRISLAGNMLTNHTTKAYFEGLLEVQTARTAPEAPPRWTAFDEDDTCNCCRNRFTWASTSNSRAQEARDKHNCRSCGGLVCDPCAKNRVPIPSIGLTVPVRVCDRCYNDIMGGVSAGSSSMTSSFMAVDDDDRTLSDASPGRSGRDGTDDESGRPERRRQKGSAVVDDLVSQMKSSALTQRL